MHETPDRICRRYLQLYRSATAEELAAGEHWYPQAIAELMTVSGCEDKPRIAAIAAHLSPRIAWTATVTAAAACWQQQPKPRGVLASSWARACTARHAEDPLGTFGDRAEKTFPFALALTGATDVPVVDIHMVSAGIGQRLIHGMPSGLWVRLTRACRTALVAAAEKLTKPITTVQATIWLRWLAVRPSETHSKTEGQAER